MRNRKFSFSILTVILLSFLFSCSLFKKKQNEAIETIDLTEGIVNKKPHNLSEIAKDIDLIKLETTEECLIGKIYQTFFVSDKIIIIDKDQQQSGKNYNGIVLVFNRDGKFLNKIGSRGKGPGEYSNINAATVDRKNEHFYISDMGSKWMKYDLSGNFIKESKLPFWANRFQIFDDKIYFYFNPTTRDQNDNYYFSICDLELNEIKKVLKCNTGRGSLGSKVLYKTEGQMRYWNILNHDTVYNVDKEFGLSAKYYLEYPDKVPYEYLIDVFGKLNNNIHLTRFSYLRETKEYIFASLIYKRRDSRVVFRKEDGFVFGPENHNWETMYTNYGHGFNNDLNGGLPFWPVNKIDDKTVYSHFNILDFKEYIKERKEHIDDGTYEELNIKLSKKQEELEEMISNSSESDNPVLVIVTLN